MVVWAIWYLKRLRLLFKSPLSDICKAAASWIAWHRSNCPLQDDESIAYFSSKPFFAVTLLQERIAGATIFAASFAAIEWICLLFLRILAQCTIEALVTISAHVQYSIALSSIDATFLLTGVRKFTEWSVKGWTADALPFLTNARIQTRVVVVVALNTLQASVDRLVIIGVVVEHIELIELIIVLTKHPFNIRRFRRVGLVVHWCAEKERPNMCHLRKSEGCVEGFC